MNCRRCTYAYEISRRGWDVKATKSINGTGQGPNGYFSSMFRTGTSKWGGDAVKFDSAKDRATSLFESLSKYPDRARGELAVSWKIGGGHSMAWEIVNGKPVLFDCQTKTIYDTAEKLKPLADYVKDAVTTRLDDAALNYGFLKRWVTNA